MLFYFALLPKPRTHILAQALWVFGIELKVGFLAQYFTPSLPLCPCITVEAKFFKESTGGFTGNLQGGSCLTIKLEYFLGGIISHRDLAMNGPSKLSNELDMDQRRSNGWQDLLLTLLLHWIILMD